MSSLFTLLTDLSYATYMGKIKKIYGRRLQKKKIKRGEIYFVHLPTSWIRSLEELPKEIIMLETEYGDLLILNPATARAVTKMADKIVKSGKARIDLQKFQRESGLWLTFRKYKGPWKSAKVRSKEGKKMKSNWVEYVTIGKK